MALGGVLACCLPTQTQGAEPENLSLPGHDEHVDPKNWPQHAEVAQIRPVSDDSRSWILPFALLVLAIVAVPLRILDDQGLPRYRRLHDELLDVREQNARLEREARALERDVEALRTDPHAIERIARDEFGMVREGELVFQFPE